MAKIQQDAADCPYIPCPYWLDSNCCRFVSFTYSQTKYYSEI